MTETSEAKKFSIPEITETLKGSPTKFFGTVRQKIFILKLRYSLAPLIHNFLTPENNETMNESPTNFFGTVRQKKLTGNCNIRPLYCP